MTETLADFADKTQRKGCWVCSSLLHPVRAEIEAGIRAGITDNTISEWLKKQGVADATPKKIYYHKTAHMGDWKAPLLGGDR